MERLVGAGRAWVGADWAGLGVGGSWIDRLRVRAFACCAHARHVYMAMHASLAVQGGVKGVIFYCIVHWPGVGPIAVSLPVLPALTLHVVMHITQMYEVDTEACLPSGMARVHHIRVITHGSVLRPLLLLGLCPMLYCT